MSDQHYQGRYRETERRAFGQIEGESEAPAREDAGQTLQTLDSDLVSFRGCIASIGTQFDGPENRRELKRMRSVIKKKITESETTLKEQQPSSRTGPAKIQFDRLSRQLEGHMGTFDQLMKQEKKATQQHPMASQSPLLEQETTEATDAPLLTKNGRSTAPPPRQAQAQAQIHLSALQQREAEAEELGELESDINDLHHIQGELAGMVQDQGGVVDQIEVEVEHAGARVEHGTHKLEEAVALKQHNRKLKCCLWICLSSIVLAVIIIIIILATVLSTQLD